MWLVVSGDGDVAYTRAFGPFDSEKSATAALPEDNDDIRWSVIELEDPSKIVYDPELVDDDPAPNTPVVAAAQQPSFKYSPQVDALLAQYGAVENIPGPNSDVYAYANNRIQQLKNNIASSKFDQSFFTAEESQQLGAMFQALGLPAVEADFANPARYDQAIQENQVELMFYEELARKHRPRAGF